MSLYPRIYFACHTRHVRDPQTQRTLSRHQASVLDHCGATEAGPWGYGDREGRGLHVMESEFIAEFLSADTDCIRARKAKITEEEWKRAVTLGRRYLDEHGTRTRDGRPASCMIPAS